MDYRQYNATSFQKSPYFDRLPKTEQERFRLLSKIFHFKVNNHVLENLVQWEDVPEDPIYKLSFPRKEMLGESDFDHMASLSILGRSSQLFEQFSLSLRRKNRSRIPYSENCIPIFNGKLVKGAYRNTDKSLFLFPRPMVSTCHAYCSYCFRWETFGDAGVQGNSYSDPTEPVAYLRANPKINEVLFTGADPLVIKAELLEKFISPLLEIESLDVININSKSLAYWPYRYTSDLDAEKVLQLFSKIKGMGKQVNICAHFTHYRELEPVVVKEAVDRILKTGAKIKSQGPIVKEINDSSEVWGKMWQHQLDLGIDPSYMFVEADHNPQSCFRVPIASALKVYHEASKACSGLVNPVIGPMFMNDVVRVVVDGPIEKLGKKYFELMVVEAPPGSENQGKRKLIPFDPQSTNLGNLYELFNEPEAKPLPQ